MNDSVTTCFAGNLHGRASLLDGGPPVFRQLRQLQTSHDPCIAVSMTLNCFSMVGAGTSSFGMSGVNAHALLAAPPGAAVPLPSPRLQWERVRFWPSSQARHMCSPSLLQKGTSYR